MSRCNDENFILFIKVFNNLMVIFIFDKYFLKINDIKDSRIGLYAVVHKEL